MRSLKSRFPRSVFPRRSGRKGKEAVVSGFVPCTERAEAMIERSSFADKQLWNQAQQGRLADALALRGDEGRDRLR